MDENKIAKKITFEDCANAIMDIGTSQEVLHIVKSEDIFKNQSELGKALEYRVIAGTNEYRYNKTDDTIYLIDNSSSPKAFNLGTIKLGLIEDDDPLLMVKKQSFGKNKTHLFKALLEFTLSHKRMKILKNELSNNGACPTKEVNKI